MAIPSRLRSFLASSFGASARDVRQALRRMRRAPGFTAIAVATLALGIGGTTAIFTAVKAVLLDPPPYQEPDRLVYVWNTITSAGMRHVPGSGFELSELRRRTHGFIDIGGIWGGGGGALGDGRDQPEQVKIGWVTGNFFSILGARPLLGRTIEPGDESLGRPATLLLSYGLWQRRFGGDPDVVGRTIRLDGAPVQVVGVMRPDFRHVFPADAQIADTFPAWKPVPSELLTGARHHTYFLRWVARLRAGVTVAQANEEVTALGREISAELKEERDGMDGMWVASMHSEAVEEIRPALTALFAGVGLVLLIACVNVANLLLARGGVRARELAVRAALGASRWRLARQLLLESMLLAVAGGVAGLALGSLCLDRLAALAPPAILPAVPLTLDRTVFAFAALVTGLAGVIFGIAPALAGSQVDLADAMKAGAVATASSHRSRAALVIAEVALGFVLLVGAGLMLRTFVAVSAVDPGLRTDGRLTFEINLPPERYPDGETRARFALALEERLRALPGVQAVGATTILPLDPTRVWSGGTRRPGSGRDPASELIQADHRGVTAGLLPAIDATLVRGRFWDALDDRAGPPVVVIDERLATELWPNEDPIGKYLEHQQYDDGTVTSQVIGVVRHIYQRGLTGPTRGLVFVPYRTGAYEHLSYVVRAGGSPAALTGAIRDAVAAIDADMGIGNVRPFADYVAQAMRPARFIMVLASLFGGLALVLAAVGIYGVVLAAVAERRRELGIRLALGATPGAIVWQLVREEVRIALFGLGLGAAGAVAVARLLGALLYGVGPLDTIAFAAAAGILLGAAVLASWLPARQAARTSPMVVLKAD